MSSSFNAVTQLFRTALAEIPNVPPIAWENTDYTPTLGQVYLRPKMIPFSSSLNDADKHQENPGLFSIGVYAATGIGEGVLLEWVDIIANKFSNLSLITGAVMVDLLPVSRSSLRIEGNFAVINVEVSFINYN